MWTLKAVVTGCLCVLVLSAPCRCDPRGDLDSGLRPYPPKSYNSAKDLKMYLDQMGEFYALVGRPRFGKRTAAAKEVREPEPSFQDPEQPPPLKPLDFLQALQYYQPPQED